MCTCSADLCGITWCSGRQNSPTSSYEKSSDKFLSKLFLLSPRIPRARLKKWKAHRSHQIAYKLFDIVLLFIHFTTGITAHTFHDVPDFG
ncbi:hypothetical protein TNCV_4038771 [Trichonephila clavipes]|nr:hypothetical protein TNCV_4038771 [Trichonephila clavipes]